MYAIPGITVRPKRKKVKGRSDPFPFFDTPPPFASPLLSDFASLNQAYLAGG